MAVVITMSLLDGTMPEGPGDEGEGLAPTGQHCTSTEAAGDPLGPGRPEPRGASVGRGGAGRNGGKWTSTEVPEACQQEPGLPGVRQGGDLSWKLTGPRQ